MASGARGGGPRRGGSRPSWSAQPTAPRAAGGVAAAAAFLERAAELTPDPAPTCRAPARRGTGEARRRRLLARRCELLAAAELGPLDELQRARAGAACARRSCSSGGAGSDAPPLLLEAARRLDRLDAAMARETYLEAIAAAMFAGRLGQRARMTARSPRLREAASSRAQPPTRDRAAARRPRDALHRRLRRGRRAALHGRCGAFAESGGGDEDRRWLWLACRMAQDLWDDELWHALATRGVRVARDTGALTLLPVMANFLAVLNVHSGAVRRPPRR